MYRVVEVGSFSFPKPDKEINEDFLLFPIHDENSNIVFAIADGVGSSYGASYASRCVIDAVRGYATKGKFSMESAILFAKQQLDVMSEHQTLYKESATTLTVIQVTDSEVVVGHIGDCRAYYKRGRKLVQLTKDHTRYQELLDTKEHSVRKLNEHKERLSSVITKALAHGVELDYDIYRFNLNELVDNKEAIITLMSDGAYEHWHKRARFAEPTMSSPAAFANSLKKRVQKCPTDDFTCLSVKIQF
ncbi:PP2C family protein-serine/threonine phosphatase [Vibrio mediterranei]|uniref:Phosphatase 2C family protein n=1 Tax=Vibrio mediterranei TaxID=689 RepID=A0ABX5DA06_9VIBR|nr:protein phosphatase 2C domain-containing protein [Vibrio mediterranei]PRQ65151.1 phosphatase 2C family protein [Vibrio mediterranei]